MHAVPFAFAAGQPGSLFLQQSSVTTPEPITPRSTEAWGQSGVRLLDRVRGQLAARSIRRQLRAASHSVMLDSELIALSGTYVF